ncbi:MAG: bacterial Ig-like domain-containing protein [Ruminococcus sp.]|nr:bacterial Ig-like domain-containing protein [Ruminococcus sp.]
MKRFKKIAVLMLTFVMTLNSMGMSVFASETTTSEIYNHGTMGITAADSNGVITIKKGGACDVTIAPYIHVQYEGCQMDFGPGMACPEICGGVGCFTKGKGCECVGYAPYQRTAKVTATSGDAGVVTASAVTANDTVGSSVGSMVNGTLTLSGVTVGQTTVTIKASLCDWITTEKTYTVKVIELSDLGVESPKTDYYAGDSFDTTGMAVKAKYTDGSEAEVTDYKVEPSGALTVEDKKVTISYTEGEITKTAEVDINVNLKPAPTLGAATVKLRYTGDPLSIKVTDGSEDWANSVNKVTIIDKDGNEKELTSEQYSVTKSAIKLNRTAEEPILSVTTAERSAEYKIKVEADGYEALEGTFSAVMQGANSFQVRLVDGEGNVKESYSFTKEEIIALSDMQDAYYNTACTMRGITTFKAKGISLDKLLDETGIEFKKGMTLQLRTNDSAVSENDSTTDNAYYSNGTFTYENLVGQSRYYFPELFTNTALKETVLNAGKFDDTVKTALGSSEKTEVSPMFAYEYAERVYRTSSESLANDAYDSLLGTENAFRFLYGLAMNAEDSAKVADETTTWSASYYVFGIDIIDPEYKEKTSVVNYEARTDHAKGTDYVEGDDTQTLYVDLTFAEEMKIVDKAELIDELTLSLGGRALSDQTGVTLDVALSEDGKTLKLTASGWFAAFSGKFVSTGTLRNLVTADESKYADANVSFYVPDGVETVIKEQVMADEETNASVTTQIVAPDHSTRGMVHFVLLKNGEPVGEVNEHGGNAVGHFHNYMTMTAADLVKNSLSTIQEGLGEEYTVTAEGDVITITAANSEPGDVLEFHIVSYLNTNNQNVDKAELKALVEEIESMDMSVYTDESAAALKNQTAIAKVDLTTGYYAQTDIDQAVARLQAAKDALVKKAVDDSTDNAEKPGDTGNQDNTDKPGSSDNKGDAGKTDNTGNQTGTTSSKGNGTVKTGDTVNFLVLVLAMAAAVAAGGFAVIDMKKRKRK